MPDETAVVNQPPQTEDTGASSHESFLGTESSDLDLLEESIPEPAEESEGEEGEAEGETAEAEGETEGEQEGEQPEPELSHEEWLEALTPNERAQYAKRYPTAWKALNDPNQPDDLKYLLRDKINGDAEIKGLKHATEIEEDLEEPTQEEEPEEVVEQPIVTDPSKQREQYYANISALAKKIVDPQSAEALGKRVLAHLGVDVKSADPQVQKFIQDAGPLGMTLAEGAIDLMNTSGPSLVGNWVNAVFPGFTDMYEAALYSQSYETVRNETGKDGKPKYGESLPDYGTREFKTMLQKASAQFPGFEQMAFPNLSASDQAKVRYQMLLQVASGQRPNPVLMAKGIETGKQLAKKQQNKLAQGRALGSGKSTAKPQGSGGDDILADIDAEIARANTDALPFSAGKR
jgi:hypothetical protein